MSRLSSTQNPKVKKWKALFEDAAARREEGLFILEGPKLCLEALKSGLKLREACVEEGLENAELKAALARAGIKQAELAKAAFRRLSATESPQGVFVVAEIPGPRPHAGGLWVALDGIQDPGNVGMILRSACAAGAGALLSRGCADPWSPKALRAAAGAQLGISLESGLDLAKKLKELKAEAWALDSRGGEPLFGAALKAPLCLVVGAEGQGLSREVRAACAKSLQITYPGPMESLNAGVSLGIALFEALRRGL